MIELDRLGHHYNGSPVLEEISFTVAPGEKVVLLGVNVRELRSD